MEIKLISISATLCDEAGDYILSKLDAKIEIGYNQNNDGSLNVNYLISLRKENITLIRISCVFKIKEYDRHAKIEVILNQVIKQLEERTEMIIGLISEEMGLNLYEELSN